MFEKRLQAEAELESHPSFHVVERMRGLGYSLEVFNGNFAQLKQVLDAVYGSNAHELISQRHSYKFGILLREITRLLHNFVASALSLIDHTRIVKNEVYGDKRKFPDYEERIKLDFVENPLARFVVKLRQYCQHYQMPLLGGVVSFDANGVRAEVQLSKAEMLKFDGWDSKARSYLKSLPDDFDLRVIITEYHRLVNEFYVWMFNRHNEIYKTEMDKLRLLQKKIDYYGTPTAIGLIKMGISSYREKDTLKDPTYIFMALFSGEDYMYLSQFEGDLSVWYRHAIPIVTNRFDISLELISELEEIFLEASQPK